MKYCTRCGLHMIESFRGCPHCQTDTHVVIVKNYGDATPKTMEVKSMGDSQPNEARLSQLKLWREEYKKAVDLLKPALNILIATKDQNKMAIHGLEDAINAVNKCYSDHVEYLKVIEKEYEELFKKMREERRGINK